METNDDKVFLIINVGYINTILMENKQMRRNDDSRHFILVK